MRAFKYAAFAIIALGSDAALSQTNTAYQSGLQLAQRRGYVNANWYAQVFARHAVVVEGTNGKRSWFAPSTPAYNAEQRQRCGVDRLADLAARRDARPSASQSSSGRRAYAAGLRVAAERGHTGAKASCFAGTYATFASVQPSRTGGRGGYAISGHSETAYVGQLFSQCGISR